MARYTHALGLLILACRVFALDLTLPTVPPSEGRAISPSLVSLSLEQDRWTDWSGTTSRNDFFFNTLDNIKQIAGEPPQIRIGADSEDRTNFRADVQFAQTIFPAPSTITPYPEAPNITVGNSYYLTARFLPSGTRVIWGVNLGSNNITAAFLEARSIGEAFSSHDMKAAGVVLDFIEVGNEPDVFSYHNHRSTSYTSTQYIQEWISFASNVSEAAGISASSHTKLFGPSFASFPTPAAGGTFTAQAIFDQGFLSSEPGKLLTTFSQHHYSGYSGTGDSGILQDLMNKAYIRGNLTIFSPDVQLARQRGLDYVLGETNSFALHGAPGVSNSAGAALWLLDYALFASQVGISRVFFHEGIGYKYNLIQPVALTRSIIDGSPLPSPIPPHVQPQYYAAIIAAEAIGSGRSTLSVEISIDDPTISGYAFFEHGKLARAVFINSKGFFKSSTTSRGSVHISFGFAGAKKGVPSKIEVKRLAIGHADDLAGLTWGGQTYETADGRVAGTLKTTKGSVESGLDISDTEVVLVTFS